MKCILVSFFNSHNLGDCIIAESLYKQISCKCNIEKYSYITFSPDFTDINNLKPPIINDKVSKKEYFYKILKKYNLEHLLSFYRFLMPKKGGIKEFEDKISNTDLLIIGGGNMIFDLNEYSESALHFNKFISIAKKYKVKIFVTSIGIGPFCTIAQEKKAIEILDKCDYITFRDKKSYDIYNKYINNNKNAFVTVDPAFLLPFNIKNHTSKKIVIGLNIFNSKLIGDNEDEYASLISSYVKLAKKLIDELHVSIVLFSTDLSDYKAVYDVYNNITHEGNIRVNEIKGLNDLIKLYGEISILIGSRMHSMIIAYTQHIPVIGLSWQQKVDGMFEIIDAKDCLFKYNAIEENLDLIVRCCNKKINDLEREKISIIGKLNIIKKKWDINNEIINSIEQEICFKKSCYKKK